MAKIKITFHKQDGAITSETDGIKGSKCTQVDSFLGGLGVVKMAKSGEFYEDAQDNDVMINTQNS
jgi:hypothetical protein